MTAHAWTVHPEHQSSSVEWAGSRQKRTRDAGLPRVLGSQAHCATPALRGSGPVEARAELPRAAGAPARAEGPLSVEHGGSAQIQRCPPGVEPLPAGEEAAVGTAHAARLGRG